MKKDLFEENIMKLSTELSISCEDYHAFLDEMLYTDIGYTKESLISLQNKSYNIEATIQDIYDISVAHQKKLSND